MSRKEVAIVGGGLVGSLLAVLLARRDHDVTIYEKRADPRAASAEAGRSINLIVTSATPRDRERLQGGNGDTV